MSSLELTAREAENLTSWNRTARGDKDDNDVLEGSEIGKAMNLLAEDRVERISSVSIDIYFPRICKENS